MKKIIFLFALMSIVVNAYTQFDFTQILKCEIYDFAIEEDTIWICTGDGLLIKIQTDGTVLDSITVVHDRKDNRLYSIAIDTNGIKWIATEGKGIYSFDGDTLINYTTDDGLAFNFTTSIAIDMQNRKWIGTEGQGISVFDGINWDTIKVTEDKKEVAYSIKIDSYDTKWISTYFGIYEYTDTVVNTYTLDSYGYLSNGTLIDSQGNIWFGTSGDGVYKFDGVNWTQYTIADGLIDSWVLALYEDYQGNIWYGSKLHGISVFNREDWISISNEELLNLEITSILVVGDNLKSTNTGKLWVGTKSGLYINDNFSLSVSDSENSNQIKLYPNPTTDYIIIEGSGKKPVEYEITNISGQRIAIGLVVGESKIDVQNFDLGLYFIKVGNKVHKIIKQ